jgi:hypothetical protein
MPGHFLKGFCARSALQAAKPKNATVKAVRRRIGRVLSSEYQTQPNLMS